MLRSIVIWGVKDLMTYNIRTDETWAIMIFVFIIQFLNTGPLLLMINSDFSEIRRDSYDN